VLVPALATAAAFVALLFVSWMLHLAHKPSCWRALIRLADTVLPLRCEWPHDSYLAALALNGRLKDALIQGLQGLIPKGNPHA
jgi:hypothetical protein